MRSNLPYSLIVWVTLAAAAAVSLPACAKSIIGEGDSDGGTESVTADSGATTQPSDDSGSPVTDPPSSDDAGNNTTPPTGDDAGSPSPGDDAGTTPPPVADSAPPVSVPDSAPPPPAQTNCPDTTKYQAEYLVAVFAGSPASCNYDSDCSSSQCCYDGSEAAGQGLCVTQ